MLLEAVFLFIPNVTSGNTQFVMLSFEVRATVIHFFCALSYVHNPCLAGTSFVTTDLENLPPNMENLQDMIVCEEWRLATKI